MKAFLFSILLLTFTASRAQNISAEQNYAQNAPGIVTVQAVFSATVYVNKVEINERIFDKLVDSVQRLDTTGTLFTPEQKLDIVVKALYKSPFRFFTAGREYFRQAHRVQSNGTGFLVSEDGYIVTNCHIIDRDSAFIRKQFIQSTYSEVTEANINALQSSWAMQLNDQQRSLLINAYGLIYSQVASMILFDLKKEFYASYRVDASSGPVAVKQKAEVLLKGRAMPGKDIAILKIPTTSNLPTLALSRDPLARIGTEVLVFGFPEPVTSNSFLAPDAGMEPSVTAGIVSATKKSVGGWPVIQMDAVISHGSSGSPVCNSRGEVIGIATFGSLEQQTSTLASGFNFAIPVSVIREFLDTAKLIPAMGEASTEFNKGLSFFYEQFYQKAKEKFQDVKKLNNGYPQLNYYLQQCTDRIAVGEDRHSPPRRIVFWIMLIIGGGAAVYLVIKKSRGE
jgi:serine protease Do